MICPRCGLALPAHARFCARCGTPQADAAPGPAPRPASAGRRVPGWLVVLFWAGSVVPLLLVALYVVAMISPPAEVVRQSEAASVSPQILLGTISLFFAVLLVMQLVAAWALTTARAWARPLATVVGVLWLLIILLNILGLFTMRLG